MKPAYTFKHEIDDNNTHSITTVEVAVVPHDVSLGELLEAFEAFVKACGYPMDGRHIDVVADD
jgi:hypothetical protein